MFLLRVYAQISYFELISGQIKIPWIPTSKPNVPKSLKLQRFTKPMKAPIVCFWIFFTKKTYSIFWQVEIV